MPRKILLSFLGNTNYSKCTYFFGEKEIEEVRFVQEATIQLLAPNCEQYHFFLTKEAEKKNWQDDGHKTRDGDIIKQDGLKTRLSKLNLEGKVNAIKNIPLGSSEEEIWEIFQKVFDQLEAGDEVYFDITHALRSIPMLVLSLIHYAKFLKEISVGGIYYGVFDPNIRPSRFPILDITTFSQLQDWTSAASNFIHFGNGDQLADLIKSSGNPILSEALEKVCQNIAAVRYQDIHEASNAVLLTEKIQEIDTANNVPLQPLLKRIDEKVNKFQPSNVLNGLVAVEWCIEHNLIQQGLTLLFEFVQTYMLVYFGESDWKDQDKRKIISWSLSIKKIDQIRAQYENGKISEDEFHLAEKVFDFPRKKELTKAYMSLGQGTRHDMNHAGIRPSPKTSDELKQSLKKNYAKIKNILQI